MKTTLVVSDPPHGDVDRRRAARHFGLSPAEAQMKANFRAPEIWMADREGSSMEKMAAELLEAGLNTAVMPGADLLLPPRQEVAESFEFTDAGLVLHGDEVHHELSYDDRLVGVFCKPPPDFKPPKARRSRSLADGLGRNQSALFIDGLVGTNVEDVDEAIERSTFLDIYVKRDDGDVRFSLPENLLDFAGLGASQTANAADNMLALVAEFERRFPNLALDRRLENVRPRLRPMVGRPIPHEEDRKLFSYGTQALSHLLESIAPDLKHLAQYELGSRIGYLLAR